MVAGWPDAIKCAPGSSPPVIFYLWQTAPGSIFYYRSDEDIVSGANAYSQYGFNVDGTYNTFGSTRYASGAGDCLNKSISQLYASGQAFNFVGGGTAAASGAAGQVQFYSGGNLAADSGLTWDNANKRLGIGTAAPASKLVVAGVGTGTGLSVENGGNYWRLGGLGSGTATLLTFEGIAAIGNAYTGPLALRTGNTDKVTILNNGNVGIGTATPGRTLTVSDPAGATFGISNGTTETYFLQHTNGNFYVTNTGISGVYLGPNSTSWGVNSDHRLKTNIKTLSVIDRLDSYRAVSFNWKQDGKHDVGVIAQELYEIFPELVIKGSDDPDAKIETVGDADAWGVTYDKLGAIALEGVKELKADNDNLRAQLKAANDNNAAAIEDLRREINALRAER
jgi:hypothetical protein